MGSRRRHEERVERRGGVECPVERGDHGESELLHPRLLHAHA